MRILAIDPSSTVLGWAVLDDDEVVVETGIVDCRKVEYSRRFIHITWELTKVQNRLHADEVVGERPFQSITKNLAALRVAATSVRKWAQERRRNLPFTEYAPAEWKASVVGNGFATKEQIAEAIRLRLPDLPESAEHVYDALGVGMHHQGIRKLEAMVVESPERK